MPRGFRAAETDGSARLSMRRIGSRTTRRALWLVAALVVAVLGLPTTTFAQVLPAAPVEGEDAGGHRNHLGGPPGPVAQFGERGGQHPGRRLRHGRPQRGEREHVVRVDVLSGAERLEHRPAGELVRQVAEHRPVRDLARRRAARADRVTKDAEDLAKAQDRVVANYKKNKGASMAPERKAAKQ